MYPWPLSTLEGLSVKHRAKERILPPQWTASGTILRMRCVNRLLLRMGQLCTSCTTWARFISYEVSIYEWYSTLLHPPENNNMLFVFCNDDFFLMFISTGLLETKVHKFQIIYTHILAGKVGAPATDPKSDFKDSNVVFLVIVHPHTSYFVDRNQVLHGQGTEEGQANCGSSMVHLLRLNDLQGLLKTLCLR